MSRQALSLGASTLEGFVNGLKSRLDLDAIVRELPISARGALEVTALIGEDTIEGIAVLETALQRSNAVALLHTAVGDSTGFLISPSTILTNNHALVGTTNDRSAAIDDLHEAAVTFNFQQDTEGGWKETERVEVVLDSTRFLADRELDFAVFGVDGEPGARWGFLDVQASLSIGTGDDVFIVQHPNGGGKQISLSGNVVLEVEHDRVRYTTDTVVGSSGSPVFDRSWNLAALHRGSWDQESNQGIRIDRIREHVANFL